MGESTSLTKAGPAEVKAPEERAALLAWIDTLEVVEVYMKEKK